MGISIPIISSAQVNVVTTVVTNASVQVIGSNINRKGAIITNAGANSAYVSFMTPAATNNYAVQLGTAVGTDSLKLLEFVYTGPIYVVRGSGSGAVVVTEFV